MTPAQVNLLKIIAQGRISELQLGIAQVNQILMTQGLTEQDKAMLSMQRGTLAATLQNIQEAYAAVEKEGGLVLGR